MKKILKNRIFIFVIALIIGASVSIYAANTYKSNSILYTASDGESMSVEDALNDLYSKKGGVVGVAIKVSSNNTFNAISKVTKTVDVKSFIESNSDYSSIDYTTLTSDNFIISAISYSYSAITSSSKTKTSGGSIVKSYDQNTGVLNLTFPQTTGATTISSGSYYLHSFSLKYDVYLIINE